MGLEEANDLLMGCANSRARTMSNPFQSPKSDSSDLRARGPFSVGEDFANAAITVYSCIGVLSWPIVLAYHLFVQPHRQGMHSYAMQVASNLSLAAACIYSSALVFSIGWIIYMNGRRGWFAFAIVFAPILFLLLLVLR